MTHPPIIEALIFDLGGVIIDIDWERSYRAWTRHTPLSVSEIRERFRPDEMYKKHERGEVPGEEYFGYLREILAFQGSDDALVDGWNAMLGEEIPATTGLIRQLNTGPPVYLFSNSNLTHESVWRPRCERTLERFTDVFVSCSLGHRKPDSIAFEAVSKRVGVDPGAMLFFDDTLENVAGAREAGVQAVHVGTPDDVRQALESWAPFIRADSRGRA